MQYGKAIYTLLNGTVGVSDRIYPMIAPQQAVKPYVVYKSISVLANSTHNKTSSVNTIRVQLDIVSKSFETCQEIEAAITAVLPVRSQGSYGTDTTIQQIEFLGMDDDQYDDEENNFIISADYEIREVVGATD